MTAIPQSQSVRSCGQDTAEVVESLGTTAPLRANERQARELAELDPEEQTTVDQIDVVNVRGQIDRAIMLTELAFESVEDLQNDPEGFTDEARATLKQAKSALLCARGMTRVEYGRSRSLYVAEADPVELDTGHLYLVRDDDWRKVDSNDAEAERQAFVDRHQLEQVTKPVPILQDSSAAADRRVYAAPDGRVFVIDVE